MAQAGRERTTFLRAYGTSAIQPLPSPTAEARIGPGFDCSVATAPLARLICADSVLAKTDLLFNQAYWALYHALDPAARRRLQQEDIEFLNSVQKTCGIPEAGAAVGSAQCVAGRYNGKRSEWLARLSGPASEEANRPIEEHIALQAQLQRLGFLSPTTKTDGVYKDATRAAISQWQTASDRPVTGFMSNADAAAFGTSSAVARLTPMPRAEPRLPSNAPATTSAGPADEVALRPHGGVYRVPVRINDQITLNFTLDSGASDVLIPADVLLTLLRTDTISKADFLGERTYVLADGSKLPSTRINLRELRVGAHRLTNVTASVGPATSDPLLGQSFLSRFKTWTFDNDRHVLVLVPGQQLTGSKTAPVHLSTAGLEVVVKPARTSDSLVVSGDIVNRAEVTRHIPRLHVVLRDSNKTELDSRVIDPPVVALAPGAIAHCSVTFEHPNLRATGVAVTFVSE